MAKTSLERSHSKASNFKLTLMCLLAAIFFNGIFAGLVLINFNQIIGVIVAIACGVLSLISYFSITRFTR